MEKKTEYSLFLFVSLSYSDYYGRTQVFLTVVGFYICLFIFIRHLKSEKRSSNSSKSIDVKFVHSIVLNVCSLWGGAMCFGRPYLPVTIYSLGIIIITIPFRGRSEFSEWIEKLCTILSVLSLVLEYFIYAFKYWIKTHKNENIHFGIKMFLIFF